MFARQKKNSLATKLVDAASGNFFLKQRAWEEPEMKNLSLISSAKNENKNSPALV
jgi:hypothetical protein